MNNESLSPVGRFETFLLATDGTEYSAAAEKLAAELAERCNAQLIIARIILSNPEYEALAPERILSAEADARQQIEGMVQSLEERGIRSTAIVRQGMDPYHEIVRLANEYRVDVIIIGRRTRSDLARLLVGDSTAKVIGLAACSVLVVPRDATMPQRRILLATDGSRLGDAAAFSAVQLAGACSLPLTAMTAVWPSEDGRSRQEGQEILRRIGGAAADAGIDLETDIPEGMRPDEVIIEQAMQRQADLIVVGSHGRTGLQRLLMGSVSERVIGAAHCPVLVVRAPG
jgi:nucleotide-binding universal stress UspA family protein